MLKALLEKGDPTDVTAAAVVLSYAARGNKGRDVSPAGWSALLAFKLDFGLLVLLD
jgi:hypothetical protein